MMVGETPARESWGDGSAKQGGDSSGNGGTRDVGTSWGDGREDSGMRDSSERWWEDSSVRQ